jgi:hypothetical protein
MWAELARNSRPEWLELIADVFGRPLSEVDRLRLDAQTRTSITGAVQCLRNDDFRSS